MGRNPKVEEVKRLYENYSRILFKIALDYTSDLQIIEEAILQTFIKILHHIDSVDTANECYIGGLLIVILRQKIAVLSKKNRKTAISSVSVPPQQLPAYALPNLRLVVGNNVRRLRNELKISQEELGFRARIGQSSVTKIENGQHNSSLGTLRSLAFEFDLNLYDLFEEPDHNFTTINSYIRNHIANYMDEFIARDSRLFAGLLESNALHKVTVDEIECGAK